jgi:hypothetical protein
VDLYQSTILGRLPHTKGKETDTSKFIFVKHQANLTTAATVKSKHAFERGADDFGIKSNVTCRMTTPSSLLHSIKIATIKGKSNNVQELEPTIKTEWNELDKRSSNGLETYFSTTSCIGHKRLALNCGPLRSTMRCGSGIISRISLRGCLSSKYSLRPPLMTTNTLNEQEYLGVQCTFSIQLFKTQGNFQSGRRNLGEASSWGFPRITVPTSFWFSTPKPAVSRHSIMLFLMKSSLRPQQIRILMLTLRRPWSHCGTTSETKATISTIALRVHAMPLYHLM